MSDETRAKILSNDELATALAKLKDWKEVEAEDAIRKLYTFRDFDAAFSFMIRVAEHARKMNHHPTWINAYKRVDVVLTTHDLGGVSTLDIRMAHLMDEAAAAEGAQSGS